MRPRFLFAPALALGLCAALPAHALTKEDAANNLMLLIGARNEAMFCEPFGKTAIKASMLLMARLQGRYDREIAPTRKQSHCKVFDDSLEVYGKGLRAK
jgi:hypothetical protein